MTSNQKDQHKIRSFLDSIKGSRKCAEAEPELDAGFKRGKSNIQIITQDVDSASCSEIKDLDVINLEIEAGRIKNRTKLIPPHSTDTDEAYIDNVLNCKERRASWTNIKSEKTKTRSYLPSLTAICK